MRMLRPRKGVLTAWVTCPFDALALVCRVVSALAAAYTLLLTATHGDLLAFLRTTPTLASLFRQPSPRSALPPSSYPSGLQPVGSRDVNGNQHRRVSRTELDFEQALRAEGTVVIKESLDIDTLGVLDTTHGSISSLSPYSSPSLPPKSPSLHSTSARPAPIVVPPPSSSGVRTASSAQPRSSTSDCSGQEVYYDAQEDTDLQTKRRSMYRSPGTASSPDLATLVRKSKGKEAASRERDRDGRTLVAPGSASQLTPNRLISRDDGSTSTGRPRSSTSSSAHPPPVSLANVTPAKSRSKLPQSYLPSGGGIGSPDWVLTSPRSMSSMRGENGVIKVRTLLCM